MAEKNIFGYIKFFVVKYFRFQFIFYVKTEPLKKGHPLFSSFPLKIEISCKASLFENLIKGRGRGGGGGVGTDKVAIPSFSFSLLQKCNCEIKFNKCYPCKTITQCCLFHFQVRSKIQSVLGKNKGMCASSHMLCYGSVRSCLIHNSPLSVFCLLH